MSRLKILASKNRDQCVRSIFVQVEPTLVWKVVCPSFGHLSLLERGVEWVVASSDSHSISQVPTLRQNTPSIRLALFRSFLAQLSIEIYQQETKRSSRSFVPNKQFYLSLSLANVLYTRHAKYSFLPLTQVLPKIFN